MQTSKQTAPRAASFSPRIAVTIAVVTFVGVLSSIIDCGSSSTCLRYSDCDQGLTCANGLCVVPPVESEGGTADGDGAVSSVEDAASSATTDSAVVLIDAASGSTGTTDGDVGDATSSADSASSDGASSADSSTPADASTD